MNIKNQLQDFFNRSPKRNGSNGYKLILPKVDPLDFKIHVSLCIFRSIQNHVLDSLIKLMCVQKPHVTVSNAMGDALIDRARSREASDFLNYSDADVLFCADDDISFSVEDAIKICQKANELKGIVAATCVIKREEGNWIASKPIEGSEPIIFGPDSELREVKWIGSGMYACHRNVFLDVIDTCKLPLCHKKDLRFWPFFQPEVYKVPNEDDFIYMSEDWSFAEKCRKSGYKIWLDPSTLSVTHWGHYGYKLEDLLRPPRPKFDDIKFIKYEDAPGSLIISKHDGTRIRPSLTQ